jgi:hypothetical protein
MKKVNNIDNFVKKCPKCNKVQSYTQIGSFNRAVKLNIQCRRCASDEFCKKRPDYEINNRGCWIWKKSIMWNGYGLKTGKLAHRVYYEKHKGKIPNGLEIDHLCRNRACVNPYHLEAVTKAINQHRGAKAKINENIAKEIRIIGCNMKQRDIAKKYNISQRLVWNVLHDLTWKIL